MNAFVLGSFGARTFRLNIEPLDINVTLNVVSGYRLAISVIFWSSHTKSEDVQTV